LNLLLAALLCQALTAERGTWGGTVIDGRSGIAIAGAEVTIVGHRGAARTDESGRFRWTAPVPPAPLTIIVVLADGRVAQPIRLAASPSGTDVVLTADPAVAEGMTVAGVAPTIDSSPGSSLTLLPTGDLEMRHPATMSQSLENVPGVGVISDGGQGSVPAIRGLARGRSLILVDGSRVSTERRAGANASFVDPATASTIEVARGPGSVAYGSDAFGGVIAVRTRAPGYREPLQVRASGTIGAGIPQGRGDVEVSRGYESDAFLVSVRAREFDDYTAPSGVVPNSAWRDGGINARWDHDSGRRTWSIGWQTGLAREIGRARSDTAAIAATTPYEDSHRLTVQYGSPTAGWFRNLQVTGLLGSSRERTAQDRQPTSRQPRNLTQADMSSRDAQLRTIAERLFGRVRVQMGADVQGRYDLQADDTTVAYDLAGAVTSVQTSDSIASAHRTGVGAFAQGDTQVTKRLRLAGGIRVDSVRSVNEDGYFGDRRVTNSAAAGLAAASLALTSRTTLVAQFAHGFRDPTLTDRFYRGPVGRGFIEGNPDLEPETSRQFDLALRTDLDLVRVSVAYYDYRIANLVERYLVGTSSFFFRNAGAARLRGAEVQAQVRLPRGFVMDLSGQVSRGRDVDTGLPVDDVAPDSINVAFRHSIRSRLDSYLRIGAVTRHDAAGPSEVPTPGYWPIDAGAVWQFSQRVQVRGLVRNLADQPAYANAGPRWVYAPGRNASITFVVEF
jgi:outer membrane receptor protein involved in Fe transport